jgi:hypothetical protein
MSGFFYNIAINIFVLHHEKFTISWSSGRESKGIYKFLSTPG